MKAKDTRTASRPIRVLLVEDNPGDADLLEDTLLAGRLELSITIVADGVQAVEFLNRRGPYTNAETPDLILLDLNLPRLDGRQVLAAIKSRDELRQIPVVILTSSDAARDVEDSYHLGANCYVTKPVGLAAFQTAVRAIEDFWFSVAKLP